MWEIPPNADHSPLTVLRVRRPSISQGIHDPRNGPRDPEARGPSGKLEAGDENVDEEGRVVLGEVRVRLLRAVESVLLRRRGRFHRGGVGVGIRDSGLPAVHARELNVEDVDQGGRCRG